jgi:hypothetical protein
MIGLSRLLALTPMFRCHEQSHRMDAGCARVSKEAGNVFERTLGERDDTFPRIPDLSTASSLSQF